ncbi:hypothetical protein BYT27DRAFT_7198198 [Phlegmacium glaucopus]|nr:hypothetical protein BYT27DRAFT_7198198 [Phlegmacium glaucopus]
MDDVNVLLDDESGLPGGDMEFRDVTSLFLEAAAELEPDSLLFMDGFTLQDAMSALEIGEPRLDSGLIVQEQLRPPFNPLTPLLPEELCWILDRSLGYETEFHAGNFLAHTIHTLLYVHHLRDIDPDITPAQSTPFFLSQSVSTPAFSNERPIELITIVLRAAVQGLLKCCSLSWIELAKGGAHDTEDWQSDKCEISLLEGTPVPFILSKLDDAVIWLGQSVFVSEFWKTALQARILLRKALLQIMSAERTTSQHILHDLVQSAREQVLVIQTYSPECSPGSPAQLAFDPYIGRRLQMFTPIRVIPPPDLQKTCDAIRRLLDGIDEISLLKDMNELVTWETVGHLRLWLPDPPMRVPYLRSLTQSTFYDGFLILHRHSLGWMVNQFFFETVGMDYDSIHEAVIQRWTGPEPAPLREVERSLYKLMTPHIRAFWNNPPRRRRHFMKSLVGWHDLYDLLTQIRDNLDLKEVPRGHMITCLPDVPLLWRLSIVREVILSGFQLGLYGGEEKSLAYWYAVEVIDAHLNCLDNVTSVTQEDTAAHREMVYQTHFLTAMRSICAALFKVSMPLMSFDWVQMRPNFYRRYKWAFKTDYDNSETPVVAQPELYRFMKACGESLKGGGVAPLDSIELARMILLDLINSNEFGGYAGLWVKDRIKFLQNMVVACDNLDKIPATPEEMDVFDASLLKWDPSVHPWFPTLVSSRTIPMG